LPTSSSHALIGGYAGAAMSRVAHLHGIDRSFDALLGGAWLKTALFIFLGPLIGMAIAYGLMILVFWMFRHSSPLKMDKYFRRLQLASSALLSFSHGGNDAQKTAGIIVGVLVAAGYLKSFEMPKWVIFSAYAAIALGTSVGRVADRAHHGVTPHALETEERILRGNRRRLSRFFSLPSMRTCRSRPRT
jgi:PiT family inorganic phosphate transporter